MKSDMVASEGLWGKHVTTGFVLMSQVCNHSTLAIPNFACDLLHTAFHNKVATDGPLSSEIGLLKPQCVVLLGLKELVEVVSRCSHDRQHCECMPEHRTPRGVLVE